MIIKQKNLDNEKIHFFHIFIHEEDWSVIASGSEISQWKSPQMHSHR